MASNSSRRSSSSASRRPSRPSGAQPSTVRRRSTPDRRSSDEGGSSRQRGSGPRPSSAAKQESTRRPGGRRGSGRSKVGCIVAAIFSAAVALVIAYVVLSNTDTFEIESIQLEGTSRLSSEQLTVMVNVSEGTNLLNVDTDSIASRLLENPWVKSVSVSRSFPHTLVLSIEENFPCAVVRIDPSESLGAIQYWLISDDGVWMSQVTSTGIEEALQMVVDSTGDASTADDESAEEADDAESTEEPSVCSEVYMTVAELAEVPYVSGVATGLTPEAGVQETDEGVLNALEILTQSDEEFRTQIASIDVGTDDATSVILTSGVEIAFGSSEDIQTKFQVAKEILEEHSGEVSYINVRVVSRPSWRGV